MTGHSVVIAGAGPTGLTLAAELALAGIDVALVEKREDQTLAGSRAGGLQSRVIEHFDQRGIAERFLSQGKTAQVNGFAWIPLSIADFPTRHPYGLGLWQNHIERILAEWVAELKVPIYRRREVTGFTQDATGVEVALSGGETLRAAYLVGCDGGRSVVRKAAGIDFPGWAPTTSWLIGEVPFDQEPKWGLHHDAHGIHGLNTTEDGKAVRVLLTEPRLGSGGEPTEEELRTALTTIYGTDFGVRLPPIWLSRFTDGARQAAAYRSGRVFLAGDAAHVHNPMGGQGLNTGVLDAANLGWKLAQVIKGTSPETLLDTYHSERHPVAAQVLRDTVAQLTIRSPGPRAQPLVDTMTELLSMEEPRKRLAARMSMLGLRYDLGAGHLLLGRRMPDLDLTTAEGPRRVFSFLHQARPLLLDLGGLGGFDHTPWADRVQRVNAQTAGPWELPALGAVPAPSAVLVRPDGYVAWVGEQTQTGLPEALTTWFGPPKG